MIWKKEEKRPGSQSRNQVKQFYKKKKFLPILTATYAVFELIKPEVRIFSQWCMKTDADGSKALR